MRARHLVYYTVGGSNADYVRLLEASVESLMTTLSDPIQVDILVLCDEAWSSRLDKVRAAVEGRGGSFFQHRTDPNPTGVSASMRKVEIFDWPSITDYTGTILYLDCDIVVVRDLLVHLFADGIPEDRLCVKYEDDITLTHFAMSLPSLNDPEVIATLTALGIQPFNCGQFAFRATPIMAHHFRRLCHFMKTYPRDDFFYEQSFMNHYFNHVLLGATDREAFLGSKVVLFPHRTVFDPVKFAPLHHVCNTHLTVDEKLGFMLGIAEEAEKAVVSPRK